ncbi:DUF4238 domain-containing protein [Brenneria populi subsp. brevivirga]|uniref:DUF4238 domain-containing protein n=1 Tax=Brenneria populi TaxID=1505588 RepID=UPI002E19728F|nr:DUF4238 domain-containing protein [Brenneria populi subsp. brevivirga]
MSGKKQHYIPQTLLKGFITSQNGKRGQAWVYKNGNQPYLSSITDIAAKRFFYSDLSQGISKTLDDKITDYENRLGPLLYTLRATGNGQFADPFISAEVVAHLSLRGAYLREIFSFGINQFFESTALRLQDHDFIRNAIGVDKYGETSLFTNELDKQVTAIKDQLPPELPIPLLKSILHHSMREQFSNFYEQIHPEINHELEKLTPVIPSKIAESHSNALNLGLAPDKRIANLSTLSWKVYTTQINLILPDCVAISIEKNGTISQPYLLNDVFNIDKIMLPLAQNKILVGQSRNDKTENSFNEFNIHAANCSTIFFISAENTSDLIGLSETIGNSSLKNISTVVTETFNSIEPQCISLNNEKNKTILKTVDFSAYAQNIKNFSFRITFKNCATQEQSERIAHSIKLVINELQLHNELMRLDEIIFAEDYISALHDVNLGYESSKTSDTIQVEGLTGIAKTITVIREGERKTCIVIRAWIGHALISETDSQVKTAAHILATMLSEVSFQELLESLLKRIGHEESYTLWESLFYSPMDGAIRAYYSSWNSAYIDPSITDSYKSVIINLLEHANKCISTERFSYGTHGDLDQLIHIITSILGDLLISIAKLIGHCDALDEPIYGDNDKLHEIFSNLNLCNWVSLYSRDLRHIFSSRENWSCLKELTSLSTHMEFQLWRYLVFPWVTEEGEVRVEVPYIGNHVF